MKARNINITLRILADINPALTARQLSQIINKVDIVTNSNTNEDFLSNLYKTIVGEDK